MGNQKNARQKQDTRKLGLGALAGLFGDMEKEAAKAEHDKQQAALDMEKAERIKRSVHRKTLTAAQSTDMELRARRAKEEKDRMSRESVTRHRAKAAGVRSIFTVKPGELLMTSFGRGNAAVPEKKVDGGVISDLNATPAYSALNAPKRFDIKGRVGVKAVVDDPECAGKQPGQDLIEIKDKLEQMMFGTTYEDNIHIQLAYSILDIDKILASHVGNIVYQINNMLRDDTAEHGDLVGFLGLGKTWQSFSHPDPKEKNAPELYALFTRLMGQPQLCYFGTTLYDPALVKAVKTARNDFIKNKALEALDKKHESAYNLITLLGMLRQAMAHGQEETRLMPYTLDESCDGMYNNRKAGRFFDPAQRIAARKTLDELYAQKVSSLNTGFLEKAKVDLKILCDVYSAFTSDEKAVLVREYYDFVVRKEFKNQGFSFTRLRENMTLFTGAKALTDIGYDSMRGRLYRLFDFVLFKYYKKNPGEADALVERLRACLSGAEKEHEYEQEARRVWPLISADITEGVLPFLTADEIKAVRGSAFDGDIRPEMLEGTALSTDASEFTKLMYLLTCFADGKEINDLLTTLINTFDNITAFRSVLKAQGLRSGFAEGYKMFGQSEKIARELRAVNSFARMEIKDQPDAKRILFVEAAKVLGWPDDEESLLRYVDNALTEQGEFIARGKDFRNFIASNVIESDRFKYLVRYGNVNKLRAVADNKNVVTFVLKGIPDTQIIRYYNSCTGAVAKEATPEMREELAGIITHISFTQFAHVRTRSAGPDAEREKLRNQAVISLYLTVLYLTVKNLVYANSRYFLAFHCVERDAITADRKAYGSCFQPDGDLRAFARDRVEKRAAEKREKDVKKLAARGLNADRLGPDRVTKYLRQDIENSDQWAVRAFRNCAEHLGAVRNLDSCIGSINGFDSWFELYHYAVQRYLAAQYEFDSKKESRNGGYVISAEQLTGKTLEYFDSVNANHSYSKDFVKALCVPFAYNLPRFKNLSIGALFDRNNYLPDKAKAE